MKRSIILNLVSLICLLISLYSCEKADEKPSTPNTKFTHKILEGHDVTSIAFDSKGNAWIGTYNKPELIKYNLNSKETVIYNSSNSIITESTLISDIAVDKKNNVWIGCDGLIKFDGVNFTKYNSTNSKIPVDFVHSIAVDSKDNIWFSSSSHLEGGLVRYDGTNWTVTSPDNSNLPLHGVKDIAIDKNDNVWLALYRYINESYLAKLANGSWTVFSSKEMGFTPILFGNIQVNSKNQVCGSIDYIFSSTETNPGPQILIFSDQKSQQFQYDNTSSLSSITVDSDDNIWGISRTGYVIFDGTNWTIDDTTFKDLRIETIVQSKDKKMWIGTQDGIYVND